MPPTGEPTEHNKAARVIPRSLGLTLFLVALAAGLLAVYFASQASTAEANAEILKDGVDRSSLPVDQAVALAELALSRSAPVPEGEGHDHDHSHVSPTYDFTPEEKAEFDAQWAAAVARVEDLDTLEEISALGYVKASGHTDGSGSHYINWTMVDRPFDPAYPSMLLFDQLVRGEEPKLIAYSYWVASDGPPEGFVGGLDRWHRHLGICFIDGKIADENLTRDECVGDWLNGVDLWMLHAWVVPGVENEYGIFHAVNPLLCEHACGLEN